MIALSIPGEPSYKYFVDNHIFGPTKYMFFASILFFGPSFGPGSWPGFLAQAFGQVLGSRYWPGFLVHVLGPGSWPRFLARVLVLAYWPIFVTQGPGSWSRFLVQVLGPGSWCRFLVQVLARVLGQVLGPVKCSGNISGLKVYIGHFFNQKEKLPGPMNSLDLAP